MKIIQRGKTHSSAQPKSNLIDVYHPGIRQIHKYRELKLKGVDETKAMPG